MLPRQKQVVACTYADLSHTTAIFLYDRTQSTTYNIRSRKHDRSLSVKHSVTANEFITRMLYKDMY